MYVITREHVVQSELYQTVISILRTYDPGTYQEPNWVAFSRLYSELSGDVLVCFAALKSSMMLRVSDGVGTLTEGLELHEMNRRPDISIPNHVTQVLLLPVAQRHLKGRKAEDGSMLYGLVQ